jgi:hypothetical protein
VKNRSFFFVSYQGQRQTSYSSGQTTVPTVTQVRDGNFGSVNIYNPASVVNGLRSQFPGNIIPASQRDPVGVNLASLYPAPNLPGLVNNHAYNQLQGNNSDQLDSRFDEQLTAKDTMFFSFSRYRHAPDGLHLCLARKRYTLSEQSTTQRLFARSK